MSCFGAVPILGSWITGPIAQAAALLLVDLTVLMIVSASISNDNDNDASINSATPFTAGSNTAILVANGAGIRERCDPLLLPEHSPHWHRRGCRLLGVSTCLVGHRRCWPDDDDLLTPAPPSGSAADSAQSQWVRYASARCSMATTVTTSVIR